MQKEPDCVEMDLVFNPSLHVFQRAAFLGLIQRTKFEILHLILWFCCFDYNKTFPINYQKYKIILRSVMSDKETLSLSETKH